MAKAKELIGAEYFDVPRQYGWIGDGGFAMHDILDNGETVQFVVSCLTETGTLGDDEWSSPLDQEGLEKALRKWDDTPLKEGVVKVRVLLGLRCGCVRGGS
jgi:salicylate hydroxylase